MNNTKEIMVLAILLIAILSTLIFLSSKGNFTGNVVANSDFHFFTKAVCNGNSCQDYNFSCNGKILLNSVPTGSVVKFSDDWNDSRSLSDVEKGC
jgi:hypothetical protein